MEFTWDTALFIFLIQFLAYIVKWLVGFGNPLISAPLLSMRLDNALITPGSLLPDLCINACITWQNRKRFRWRRILPLLLCMLLGDLPGTWLLRFSLPWLLKAFLGLVVLLLGLEMATRGRRPPGTAGGEGRFLPCVVSFFSGMCSALFGINMFLVAYLQRTAGNYDEFKGSICFLFLGEGLFRTVLYAYSGLLNGAALQFALISMTAALLSPIPAGLLSRRMEGGALQRLAVGFFLLGGVSILVKALLFRA